MTSVKEVLVITKHDTYVETLYNELKPQYDQIFMNYSIFSRKSKLAEIDILGIKGRKVHVFEVKCSHRIAKARKQLMRIKRLLNAENIALFFYCGKSQVMERIEP